MTVRLAIFDCDGTLVDGQAAVCDAMEAAFAEVNEQAPSRTEIRRIVGLSLPQAVRHLSPHFTAAVQEAIVDAYKQSFRDSRMAGRLHEPLFEGIEQVLRALHADGWALAVATGKSDRGLQACLAGHGISDLFCSLQTADRHPSKPHPAMLNKAMADAQAERRDTIMIGDTSFDIMAGVAARVRSIGVSWGYHPPHELLDAGATCVVDDAAQIGSQLSAMTKDSR
ncbi:HAD-IA family hydrolase [Altererythrobacter aquiaggeris]|uniref:HAD-IA family hydrolase n=1 Tax=Aestuarierythrobacter aquiaggeris TaxID=1898396 RepID=UPI0030166959